MNNKVMIVWGVLVLAVFLLCSFFAIKFKKNEEYYNAEKTVKTAAHEYLTEHDNLPNKNEIAELKIDDLIDNNYIEEVYVNGNKCDGNISVTKGIFTYKYDMEFICGNY